MKRLLISALVVCTLCLPALAQKKGTDDFNDLIKRYYTAWNTLNPDNASFLYAQDADLIFFDIAPLKYSGGWPEYRDNFKKNVGPSFSTLTLTPNHDCEDHSPGQNGADNSDFSPVSQTEGRHRPGV